LWPATACPISASRKIARKKSESEFSLTNSFARISGG
jgi:hypothetical protein